MKKYLIPILFSFLIGIFLFAPHALAVTTDIGEVNNIGDFATKLMQWAQPLIIILAVIMLIVAGYFYMTSGGNPEGIKTAKEIILGVVLGLALLYLASLLFKTIGVPVITPTPTPPPAP